MCDEFIQKLSDSLASISLEENKSEDINMPLEVNFNMLKLNADSIPPYDGSELRLEPFINAVDRFYRLYFGTDNTLNECINSIIIGKLRDRAEMLIGARPEINDWPQIKITLRNAFGDNLSLDVLEQALFIMTINKNESYLDFARRIQAARSKLCFKINSMPPTEMPVERKLISINQYENQALKVFLRNLNIRNCDYIRAKSPSSLEEAIGYFIENENFLQMQQQTQIMQAKSNIPQKPINNQIIANRFLNTRPQNSSQNYQLPNMNNIPNNFQFPNMNNIPNNFQNLQIPTQSLNNIPKHLQNYNNFNNFQIPRQSNFPSQPINIQSRPVQHKFPTNAQTFGQTRNVFKPNQTNAPRNMPEPMSIQSRQPTLQRQNNNFNQQPRLNQQQIRQQFPWFQQKTTPKYVTQELHAIDDEQLNENSYRLSNYNNQTFNNEQTFNAPELNYELSEPNYNFPQPETENENYYPEENEIYENPNFLDLPQRDQLI